MSRAPVLLLLALCAACTTPLDIGERRYREGDRLGALEVWREIPEDDSQYDEARERTAVVEEEFQQLVVRYKKRAKYFEEKGRLAESILNYRLALKLQPQDAETLDHVQELARQVAAEKAEAQQRFRAAFDEGDLATTRQELDVLVQLDPFDPQLGTEQRVLKEAVEGEVTRRLVAGRRAFVAGNHRRARDAFQSVLEIEPDNESALGYLSYIDTLRREGERARQATAPLEVPETFASDSEIRAEGFYQNALAAERAGDGYAAIRHDLRALRADPNHRQARNHLATTRRRLGGRVDERIEQGRIAFRDEDLQSALDLWRRALLVDPDNERAKAYVGRAQRQLQNLERLRSEPEGADGDRGP